MKKEFNGIWYVSKMVTRKGRTYEQWFRCKAPSAAELNPNFDAAPSAEQAMSRLVAHADGGIGLVLSAAAVIAAATPETRPLVFETITLVEPETASTEGPAWGRAETVTYPGEETLGEPDPAAVAELVAKIEQRKSNVVELSTWQKTYNEAMARS